MSFQTGATQYPGYAPDLGLLQLQSPWLSFPNANLMPQGNPYLDPYYQYKFPQNTYRPTYYGEKTSGGPASYAYGWEDIRRGYTFDSTAKLWRLFAPADLGEYGGFGLGIGATQEAAKVDFCARYQGGKAAATCLADASPNKAESIIAKYLGGASGQVPTPATAQAPDGKSNTKKLIYLALGGLVLFLIIRFLKF